jgi:hypothetical protein
MVACDNDDVRCRVARTNKRLAHLAHTPSVSAVLGLG